MDRSTARWAPLALAVIVVVGIAATQQIASQVAYVNLQEIMQRTPGYQEAADSFETVSAGVQGELAGLQTSYDSAVTAFQQSQVVLTPTARQEKQAELEQMGQRFAGLAQEIQNRLMQQERQLLAPLEERVQSVIEGIRAERNISVIFDVSQQPSAIISADTNLDLTGVVIQRLTGSGP